jgi:hypothetical protein
MPEQLGRHQSVAAPKPAPPLGALAGCSRPQGTAGRQTGSNSQALKHPALQQYCRPGRLRARAGVAGRTWCARCTRWRAGALGGRLREAGLPLPVWLGPCSAAWRSPRRRQAAGAA